MTNGYHYTPDPPNKSAAKSLGRHTLINGEWVPTPDGTHNCIVHRTGPGQVEVCMIPVPPEVAA